LSQNKYLIYLQYQQYITTSTDTFAETRWPSCPHYETGHVLTMPSLQLTPVTFARFWSNVFGCAW